MGIPCPQHQRADAYIKKYIVHWEAMSFSKRNWQSQYVSTRDSRRVICILLAYSSIYTMDACLWTKNVEDFSFSLWQECWPAENLSTTIRPEQTWHHRSSQMHHSQSEWDVWSCVSRMPPAELSIIKQIANQRTVHCLMKYQEKTSWLKVLCAASLSFNRSIIRPG